MTTGNLFRLQLVSAFGNRRGVVLRVGIGALLATPFILINMPARAKAIGIVMVILFTGFFGAAVGHARLRCDLRLTRLALLPTPRQLLWLDIILASMLERMAPCVVVLNAFIVINGRDVTLNSLIGLTGLMCAAVLLLTLLGIATSRLAHNNGEVHLFGAMVCSIIAFLSGITGFPEKLSWLKTTMAYNPIARLFIAVTQIADGSEIVDTQGLVLNSITITALIIIAALRWYAGGK